MSDQTERDAVYQTAIQQAQTQRTPTDRRKAQLADWTGIDRRVGDRRKAPRLDARVWTEAERGAAV